MKKYLKIFLTMVLSFVMIVPFAQKSYADDTDYVVLNTWSSFTTYDIPNGTKYLKISISRSSVQLGCSRCGHNYGSAYSTNYAQLLDSNDLQVAIFSGSIDKVDLSDYPNATKVKLYGARGYVSGGTCTGWIGNNHDDCLAYNAGKYSGYGSVTVVCYGLKGPQFGAIPGSNLTEVENKKMEEHRNQIHMKCVSVA